MGEEWGIKAAQGESSHGTHLSNAKRLTESENNVSLSQSNSKSATASGAAKTSIVTGHRTDSVESADFMGHPAWLLILRAWYGLTGRVPRRLPDTDDKLIELKRTLIAFYGLEDRPDVWLTVLGQMASLTIKSRHMSYRDLATAGHRLTTNAVIKKHKDIEISKLHARIEEIAKQMKADEPKDEPAMSSETHDLQGDVQALQGAPQGMVSNSRAEDGLY